MNSQIDHFRDAIFSAGLAPPDTIEIGKFIRFPTNGRRSDTSGWCKLFATGRAGAFGDFRSGFSSTWVANDDKPPTLLKRQSRAKELDDAKAQAVAAQAIHWKKNASRNSTLVEESWPVRSGDPVSRYLQSRGIESIKWPQALRYHPRLEYWDHGRCVANLPGMLGIITDASDKMVGLHRTFLTHDGCKAEVDTVKKLTACSGQLAGCRIKLGNPSDINDLSTIGVAEGIETALACMAASGTPTVSAISASGLASYQWPNSIEKLIVFSDNDSNRVGQNAADKLAHRAKRQNIRVRVLTPPEEGTDWADVWASQESSA